MSKGNEVLDGIEEIDLYQEPKLMFESNNDKKQKLLVNHNRFILSKRNSRVQSTISVVTILRENARE